MRSTAVDFVSAFIGKAENRARYEQTLAQQLAITRNGPDIVGHENVRRADGSCYQHQYPLYATVSH
ncbi:hypothetical protein [Hymenobacter sp. YC55]|uniref:hypothetical protein n=1 Tax=Hymenobacter sp. YC55 TaxID=3034019 RepID=UPI0023F65E50|nr:hypothetical protein [Hymenobacter sp. YC55]MDF7814896.1 hypothetical protein [Hymenobacter sp. YC55]